MHKYSLRSYHVLLLLLAVLLFAVLAQPLLASGGGSTSSTPSSNLENIPTQTPEQIAADHYNAGLRLRDKAWKLEEKAEAASTEAERQKVLDKMSKQFDKAIDRFKKATELQPAMHQAWSSLGYALRRTGQFETALAAYDKALALAPNYSEAIEYRAEAYLGLDRIDDAKKSYMFLFSHDRERADELLEAMQEWVESRPQDGGDTPAELVESFSSWLAERSDVASQVAAGANASW